MKTVTKPEMKTLGLDLTELKETLGDNKPKKAGRLPLIFCLVLQK